MFIEWLFTFFVVYLLYKLVFDFIVPVYRTSTQMRDRVNQMHQQQHYQQQKPAQPAPKQKSSTRPSSDDYIDFEEIK